VVAIARAIVIDPTLIFRRTYRDLIALATEILDLKRLNEFNKTIIM